MFRNRSRWYASRAAAYDLGGRMQNWLLYVKRDKDWQLVGQYPSRRLAKTIAADYNKRGERTKIVRDR